MFISVELFVFPAWSFTCDPGHVVVVTLGDLHPLQEGLLLLVCRLTCPCQAAQTTWMVSSAVNQPSLEQDMTVNWDQSVALLTTTVLQVHEW